MTQPLQISTLITSLLLSLVLVSCQSTPKANKTPQVTSFMETPVAAPAPPSVADEVLMPRVGEALAKARLTLEQVVVGLPHPSYLPTEKTAGTSQPSDEASTADKPLPLEAQHAYVAGRLAFHQRQYDEAIRRLNDALRLAPDAAEILKLLGVIQLDQGNAVRAGLYLERAVEADSGDLENLFLLARIELRQRHTETAIAILTHALTLPEDAGDPALRPMIAHFLAGALEGEGYDAAAVDAYTANLDRPLPFYRSSRYAGELYLLQRQRGQSWLSVGDALNRLGRHAEALAAYQNAAHEEDGSPNPDAATLAPRVVFTLLRLGRIQAAQSVALSQLPSPNGQDPFAVQPEATATALEIIAYVTRHIGASPNTDEALRLLYDAGPRNAGQTLVIAKAMSLQAAGQLLTKRVLAHPEDRQALRQLLRMSLLGGEPEPATVLKLLFELMVNHPDRESACVDDLLGVFPPQAVLDSLERLGDVALRQPGLKLAIAARQAQGLIDQGVLEDGQESPAAARREMMPDRGDRILLARQLIAAKRWDEARQALAPLLREDRRDFEALGMLLLSLHKAGLTTQAQTLLSQRLTEYPRNAELLQWAAAFYQETDQHDQMLNMAWRHAELMPDSAQRAGTLAVIALRRKQYVEAIGLLTRRLEVEEEHPVALLSLLAKALDLAKRGDEIDGHYERALARFPAQAGALRLNWAGVLDGMGQRRQAETHLRKVLADEPTNAQATNMLGYLLAEAGEQLDAAARLIQTALEQAPDSAAYLDSLGWVRYKQGQMNQALELLQQARLAPGGDDPVILDHLADTLWRMGRTQEAVAYWSAAREKLGDTSEIPDRQTDTLRQHLDAKITAAGQTPADPPLAPLP